MPYNDLGDNHEHLLPMVSFQLYATDLKILHRVTSLLIEIGKELIRGSLLIGSQSRQNRLQQSSGETLKDTQGFMRLVENERLRQLSYKEAEICDGSALW